VARSFSGDAKQVRELLKAALSHRGTAVLDIISPCVAFNNHDSSTKSYGYGKDHEEQLHDIGWVPPAEEIEIGDYAPGEMKVVEMHDGSHIQLRKLEEDYDPTDKMGALHRLMWAEEKREFITGLVYYDGERESLAEASHLTETPLAHLPTEKIRPSADSLAEIMSSLM
jgi:2-oxoglutarate ferredoxin oxidoreductase subunit beta